ncbi:MAG: RtcB family protein [Candidatus Methanofastidiosia archaeon]
MNLKKISDSEWEIERHGNMKVPVRIFADQILLEKMKVDRTLHQAQNVAHLPSIYNHSIVLPDGHQGYGFPIGGVAAIDAREGVISPGGVGYDINCGVRLLKSELQTGEVLSKMREFVELLFRNIPSGLGSKGKIRLKREEIDQVLELGARWAVEKGYGYKDDLKALEENGGMRGDSSKVSENAKRRGIPQLGSLGSGNHFLEVQKVDKIYSEVAREFGFFENQICIMIHTGSRGCGHQICSDYLRVMERASHKFKIPLPDRELACAPFNSKEGSSYFFGMACAANYAWANRQMITHWVRESFERLFKSQLEILYDVAHNIAKREVHEINGKMKEVIVHRKGATRAFWKGREELKEYKKTGQPVFIPGDMGSASFVLVGVEGAKKTFGSTARGAGRELSRKAATRKYWGEKVLKELHQKGITLKAASMKVIAEEAPGAYKDVSRVADVCEKAGISDKVVRLRPIGVVKG